MVNINSETTYPDLVEFQTIFHVVGFMPHIHSFYVKPKSPEKFAKSVNTIAETEKGVKGKR